MNRSGAGIGSASATLIFAVLCLAIFALISHTAAGNDRALADAEARLVTGYYEADALAERIVADILASDTIPKTLHGVEVSAGPDGTAEFCCPVSGRKELYVRISLQGDSCDILSWRLRDAENWLVDEHLPVWPG